MARLRQQAFPLGDYNGTNVFGPLNIRQQDLRIEFSVRRCTLADQTIWPNDTTLIDAMLELSLDNGQTWQGVGGFTDGGGISIAENGERQSTVFQTALRGGGNQRRVRGTVIITNGPLRSEGFLDLLDS